MKGGALFGSFFNIKNPIIGVDIGHSSIKVAKVIHKGKHTSLISIGEVSIAKPPFTKDGIADQPILISSIKEVLRSAGPKKIRSKLAGTAIPASLVFTKLITSPKIKPRDLTKAIPQMAEDFLPVPIDEYILDWQIVNENVTDNSLNVFVVAAPKKLIYDLVAVFSNAGLELAFIEIKPLSIARALTIPTDNSTVVLVDIGSDASGVSIVENGNVKATSTIKFGAQNIAKTINTDIKNTSPVKLVNIPFGAIPTYKAQDQILKPITEEVNKLIKYYRSRIVTEEKVKEIRICGGGAVFGGISSQFAQSTTIPVIIANPLQNISYCPKNLITLELLKYSVAIGLSLRQEK